MATMATNEEYDQLYNFLHKQQYPAGFSENKKRGLRRKATNYMVERGLLFYRQKGKQEWRQIPRSDNERQRILEVCHILPEGSHLGRDKTYHKIAERFYWKSLWNDVTIFLKNCEVCQTKIDAKSVKEAAPLHPIPVKPEVWRQVRVDLIGPLPKTISGNRYIVTLIDYFSKWPEAAALPDKEAEGVALFLYKMICRYGCTKFLIPDQGQEFINKIENLFQHMTEQRFSSTYHAQTNESVEQFNKTLQRSLVKLANKEQHNWDEFLDEVLLAYRTSSQTSAKFTPFELMYCRKPVLPIEREVVLDKSAHAGDDSWEDDVDRYCEELVKLRKEIYGRADKIAQGHQKRDYDNKHHHKKELEVGTMVLLRNSAKDRRKGDKLAKRWLGPYSIEECLGKGVYRLSNPATGHILKKEYNGCRLKRFFKRSFPKPVKLDDSELFQLHSPTITHESAQSLPSSVLPSEQFQEEGGTNSMDESIPPLPPSMPTLEQLQNARLITHLQSP